MATLSGMSLYPGGRPPKYSGDVVTSFLRPCALVFTISVSSISNCKLEGISMSLQSIKLSYIHTVCLFQFVSLSKHFYIKQLPPSWKWGKKATRVQYHRIHTIPYTVIFAFRPPYKEWQGVYNWFYSVSGLRY